MNFRVSYQKRLSSIDIIRDDEGADNFNEDYDECGKQLCTGISYEEMGFFCLPYLIQVEIASLMNLRDLSALACTCTAGMSLINDQAVWRLKLRYNAKIVNVCLENLKDDAFKMLMILKDPLFLDLQRLYKSLTPDTFSIYDKKQLDIENILFKLQSPASTPSITEIFGNIINSFLRNESRTPLYPNDPFSRGVNAPTFLLFGPESRPCKKLALSFIASKDATFETVGLVKGKPGGVGGGVTVRYGRREMNLLPVRRIRPRLLVEGPNGTMFHPDVAEVVATVNGLICYMDASCCCQKLKSTSPPLNTSSQNTQTSPYFSPSSHTVTCLELEAMMRTIPAEKSPQSLSSLPIMGITHPQFQTWGRGVKREGMRVAIPPQDATSQLISVHYLAI